ncbi:MAG: hypothetical protein IJ805_00575, partial [Lachnospiraceae bacterium]|nr:hypothetical protein [Lachnospiraceae bacterium]
MSTAGTYKHGSINPAPAYNFALEVEAMFFMPLKSVHVFTKENEFDYYQEGGVNDYIHMLRKPISKPFTFQVERYVGMAATADFPTSFFDPIALGTDLILPVILYVTHFPAASSGDNFKPTNVSRVYIFTGCTVTSKEYGELNAERSGLLTETTTIAYKELFTINSLTPNTIMNDPWEYPKDGTTEIKYARKQKNTSRENMEKPYDSETKTGKRLYVAKDATDNKKMSLANLDFTKVSKNPSRIEMEDKYNVEKGYGKRLYKARKNDGDKTLNPENLEFTKTQKNNPKKSEMEEPFSKEKGYGKRLWDKGTKESPNKKNLDNTPHGKN